MLLLFLKLKLSINNCGKLIIPQKLELDSQLDFLSERARQNGAIVEMIDNNQIKEIASFAEIDLVNMFLKSGIANVELKSIYNEIKTYTDKILSNPKRISYAEYSKDQLPRGINVRMKEINNDNISMVKALSRGYRFCLEEKDAIFIGEDIADPYGGAFKVTKGFQDSHPNNVYSTSISEAGLVGIAIGMSLDGHKAFAEIMFGDFMMNCMDQIVNNASKFHHMYGKQIFSDIVIRTPMGGRRGYGPTHSQSLEKFLLGIDNTMVAAVSSLKDPLELIKELNNINCPKIVIENKTDYSNFLYNPVKNLLLENIGEALGTARLSPIGGKSTLLIIAYGYVARLIADNYVKIFKESDCVFTLICPQLLHPIPIDHFKQDAKKIKHILLVEESTAGFGWADGVASAFLELDEQFKIFKLSSDPVPIPSNRDLEALNLVSIEKIIEKISLIKEHYDRS